METKVIKLDITNIDTAAIKEAAAIIDAGGLVAFPTETVYGFGCRVADDSLARLNEVKGRQKDKYYTLHIANPADVFKYVPSIGLRARALARNAWPGPLTIVFELAEADVKRQKGKLDAEVIDNLYRNSSIGIRCPDNAIASMLLSEVKSAVVAPSANISGDAPAAEAGAVIERFNGKIDMILDGGPCKYKQNSTVAKIDQTGLKILRQGAYSEPQLIEMAKVTVLFVCTGNSCRSPMAEGLFKKYLAEKFACSVDRLEEKGYIITSAGTLGMVGFPASSEAVRACSARGIDISGHRSKALGRYLIEQSELIFALARGHRDVVLEICPEAVDRCLLLAEDADVPDPVGRTQGVYDSCCEMIEKAVRKRIKELVL